MRSLIGFSVCLLGLIAVGANAHPHPARVVVKASQDQVQWRASVKSQLPHSTNAAAWNDALKVAAHELFAHMHDQQPPLEYVPAMQFIRDRLKVHAEEHKEYFAAPIDGYMYRIHLDVELRASHLMELYQHDRELRGQARQGTLARILVGIVAFALAVAAFVRLDDWTKGFLTIWLSLGAVGLVTAVIGGLIYTARLFG
jgi:hypothetical protein